MWLMYQYQSFSARQVIQPDIIYCQGHSLRVLEKIIQKMIQGGKC